MTGRLDRVCSRRGLTLVETMMSVAIFSFVVGAILMVMLASNSSWKVGQNKITEQQESRRVMDTTVRLLRQTRPEWVTIEASGFPNQDKILFYEPAFDTDGLMSPGDWVVIRPVSSDNAQLETKTQSAGAWKTIAQKNSILRFGGGCANCASFNCTTPDATCPVIKIDMQTTEDRGFNMTTYVTLRNHDAGGSGGGVPTPPAEEEF